MKLMTMSLFLPSKFSLRSCQKVTIRNPVEVIAEYAIKNHCSPSLGMAQRKAVIMKLENEYPYIPINYMND